MTIDEGTGTIPIVPNSRRVLTSLLASMLERPEHRDDIAAQIEAQFGVLCAPLIIDMCGFTRITHDHGIIAFLLMIHEMHKICGPVIGEHGGKLIKTEADNLFCLFDSVPAALNAAVDIVARLETVNLVLPQDRHLYASIGIGWGRILNIEDNDVFGDEINLTCKLSEDIATRNDVLFTERAHAQITPRTDTVQRSAEVSGLNLTYFELIR